MKETTYYKSGKQLENLKLAIEKSIECAKLRKKDREDLYNTDPTLCNCCGEAIPYQKRHNMFCSHSCSAKTSNTKREPRTAESRKLTSDSMRRALGLPEKPFIENRSKKPKKPKSNSGETGSVFTRKKKEDVPLTCPICGTVIMVPFSKRSRKTCGNKDCIVQACVGIRTYQNGSRKPILVINPLDNTEVWLDSSWEVRISELLNVLNIRWIRPKFIKWVDSTNKVRRYFPDFYLLDYEVYLDPKNPYCMKQDTEKLEVVSKTINLVYGDIKVVEDFINSLCTE
jgi:hypothetical protein